MSNRFKILCPDCGGKSTLSTLKYRNHEEAELFCCCNDATCGHSFLLTLSCSRLLAASKLMNKLKVEEHPHKASDQTRLKIHCPTCGTIAVITKTNRKHALISDIYCRCQNPSCGCRFVSSLSFSRTISPSATRYRGLIQELVNAIPPAEQAKAVEILRYSRPAFRGR